MPAKTTASSDAARGAAPSASTRRPNVVYIVLDDVGFAATGAFGNDIIQTPNIDRLAVEGLRYNNFHTTAICSATRASLLTGANHHKVGVGSVIDFQTGNPNNLGHVDHAYGTTAEILKELGYATFAVGKWHLSNDQTPAGPYDDWPLGRGFDRFYGVLPAMGDQFHPILTQDNTFVDQPRAVEEGYHLSEDIVDHAIDYVFTETTAYPDKPFFLYVAFGATHTPFHVPVPYVEKYRGAFHEGWDVLRRRWYENEKRRGVIPADAALTPRNELVPAWDELGDEERVLAERFVETYAGFLEHTDAQIGRLLDYLREAELLDDTIVVFLSDNGASGEGGRDGRFNSLRSGDRGEVDNDLDEASNAYGLAHLDEAGGEYSYVHYPQGWANAFNTPFPWYKTWAFEGGVKDDLIVRYPAAIADPGAVRGQYVHVSDVTPTILEELGVEKPASIKGVAQQPFTGTSFAYTLGDPDAADRKREQYYEMLGNRALYRDGWKAVANHAINGTDYSKDTWELYHVAEDYSESRDVAAEYPAKLRELQDAFLVTAGENNVFPLFRGIVSSRRRGGDGVDAGSGEHSGASEVLEPRPIVLKHIIKPFRLVDQRAIPTSVERVVGLDGGAYRFTARIRRDAGDDGVIIARGDRFGGFSLFIKDGKLRYSYNDNQIAYTDIVGEGTVPEGASAVGFEFREVGGSAADGADVRLLVDGAEVGTAHVPELYSLTGWPTVLKANPYTEVTPAYEVPFEFTGTLDEVRIEAISANAGSDVEGARGLHDALHAD